MTLTSQTQSAPVQRPLIDQLLMAFPAGSYCLPALFRLVQIVESDRYPTAAVECTARPRMHINPAFVARHADTPEKLLMLVLHELHHVILGHTRRCQRATPLDNLVFDAVINAMLCRQLPQTPYLRFFQDLYRDDEFPWCFLRPADGWTADCGRDKPPPVPVPVPAALKDSEHQHLAPIYQALYSPKGATYSELRQALGGSLGEPDIDLSQLLGDHRDEQDDASSAGDLEHRAPELLSEIRRIVSQWPTPSTFHSGPTLHDELEQTRVHGYRFNNRGLLTRLFRRIGGEGISALNRRWVSSLITIESPIPRQDRRSTVTRAMGGEPLLYRHPLEVRRPTHSGSLVHVYVDVSGSMDRLVGPLYAAVLGCSDCVHPVIHLFSTRVVDVSLVELRQGIVHSTGGTSIACVAAHLRENGIDRAVLLTDGEVGAAVGDDADTLRQTRLGVAFTQRHSAEDLTPYLDARCVLQGLPS